MFNRNILDINQLAKQKKKKKTKHKKTLYYRQKGYFSVPLNLGKSF